MNKRSTADRTRIVSALVEGNSIRATCRMTGAAKNMVAKLLVDLGVACAAYHDANVRNVASKRVQCDEIWSFVGAKQKNVSAEQMEQGMGDVWTWTALDADSKLIVSERAFCPRRSSSSPPAPRYPPTWPRSRKA